MEAAGGAELLRQVLEEQRLIDGTYTSSSRKSRSSSSARSSRRC